MPDVGDTPHTAEEATLVDHESGSAPNPPVEGDRPVEGEVHLVEDTSTVKPPTAAEMRALGYLVPDDVADDAVPLTLIQSDQPLGEGKVNLYVEEPTSPAAADEATANVPEAEDPNYQAGKAAASAGQPRSDNPNDGRTAAGRTWFRGYDSGPG